MCQKLNRKTLIPVLLLTLILSTALRSEKVEEVINPRQASGSFVSDGGGVLGPEYTGLIDGVCRELKEKTTVELAVVTVGDLGGLVIEDFAEKLFRRFAVGVAGKDNGLLLLCSRDDRAVRIEVGYGLEGTITDAQASSLLDINGVPYLRDGLFGRALLQTARELAKATAAADGVVLAGAEPNPWPQQVTPPAPLLHSEKKEKKGWDPLLASLYFGMGLLALAGLGLAWTWRRFGRARGRAARAKVIGSGQGADHPRLDRRADLILPYPRLRGKIPGAVRGHADRPRTGHGRSDADVRACSSGAWPPTASPALPAASPWTWWPTVKMTNFWTRKKRPRKKPAAWTTSSGIARNAEPTKNWPSS